MYKIEYFCDICGKKAVEATLKSFDYGITPKVTRIDICINCQYNLILAALGRTDIVNPRIFCKTCLGRGYITMSDNCGPYPDRKTEPCPDCGKIIA